MEGVCQIREGDALLALRASSKFNQAADSRTLHCNYQCPKDCSSAERLDWITAGYSIVVCNPLGRTLDSTHLRAREKTVSESGTALRHIALTSQRQPPGGSGSV
jgi:hypothetical protein